MYVSSLFVLCLSAHICHTVTAVTCHTGKVTVAGNENLAAAEARIQTEPVLCAAGQRCMQSVAWAQRGTAVAIDLKAACDVDSVCTEDNMCGRFRPTVIDDVLTTAVVCCCNTDECEPDAQQFETEFKHAEEEYKKYVEEATGGGQSQGAAAPAPSGGGQNQGGKSSPPVTAITCHTGQVIVAGNENVAVAAAKVHTEPKPCAAGQRCIQSVGWGQSGTAKSFVLTAACDVNNECESDIDCGKITLNINGVVSTAASCCCNTDKCDPDPQTFQKKFNDAAEDHKKAVEKASGGGQNQGGAASKPSGSGQNEGGIKAIILVLIVQLGLAAVIA